jgi:hypothetical protein
MLKLHRYKQARRALGLESAPPLDIPTTLKLSDFTRAKSIDRAQEEGEVPVVEDTMGEVLHVHADVDFEAFINYSPRSGA